jgi:hypothetical protein
MHQEIPGEKASDQPIRLKKGSCAWSRCVCRGRKLGIAEQSQCEEGGDYACSDLEWKLGVHRKKPTAPTLASFVKKREALSWNAGAQAVRLEPRTTVHMQDLPKPDEIAPNSTLTVRRDSK